MAISQFPRPGRRLAPETLRGWILGVHAPPHLVGGARIKLYQLDETSWQRFGAENCERLAHTVVEQVRREFDKLSLQYNNRALPRSVRTIAELDALELEQKTYDCLEQAIRENNNFLKRQDIRSVVNLEGFSARCLVDLLTSLESANQSLMQNLSQKAAVMKRETEPPIYSDVRDFKRKSVSGKLTFTDYPREGFRLAPVALSEVLNYFAPPYLVNFERIRLFELDESSWTRFGRENCQRLGEAVVAHLERGYPNLPASLRACTLPGFYGSLDKLENLEIERETYNCLRRFDWLIVFRRIEDFRFNLSRII